MKRGKKTDLFADHLEEDDLKRERHKARELRETQWWKRRLAKGACHYCGRMFPPRELTMDHIVPISRGGKTTKGNVVACCKECNNAKKQLLPMEWEAAFNALAKPARNIASSRPPPRPIMIVRTDPPMNLRTADEPCRQPLFKKRPPGR